MEWGIESCMIAMDSQSYQEWVDNLLRSPEWENPSLARRAQSQKIVWPGPTLVSLSEFEETIPTFKFSEDADNWRKKVDAIASKQPKLNDLPPVFARHSSEGKLHLLDGSHRLAALEQLGYTNIWAIVFEGSLGNEFESRSLDSIGQSAEVNTLNPYPELAEEFRKFAEYCDGSSELYGYLTLKIAEDNDLLAVASKYQPGQLPPNLLFGAVHLLLLSGKPNPLVRYYPSMTIDAETPDHAYPAFRKFVLTHEEQIEEIMRTKLVQTNEVTRSAFLYPAFLAACRLVEGKPLALIELGCSAGFNLLWDYYLYQYGDDEPIGSAGSSLTVPSSFRGDNRPDFSGPKPAINSRIGIDLNPIDLMDRNEILWLQALIWPEHFERKARLNKAIRIAMVNPVEMIKGDAIELLPQVLADVPGTDVPVVYHTFFANQLSEDQRSHLLKIIEDFGTKRDVIHIHNCIEPHLHATISRNGERTDIPLANVDPHGRWIEWLA